MSHPPERPDDDIGSKNLEDCHHVVFLIKRPAYALSFAVSRTPPSALGAEQALLHMHFTHTRLTCDITLGLNELEDFYEDLLRLMEYIRLEREGFGGQL
jgi:hypothetical protein